MGKQITIYGMLLVLIAMVSINLLSVNTVQAQNNSRILSMTEFTLKQGHNTQFREGIKAWKNCYLENNGEWTWNLWSRVQGEGNVYLLASYMDKWAEMDDASDEAGQACQNLAVNLINPSVEKTVSNMARTMPDMSKDVVDGTEVVSVYLWRINNSTKFLEAIRSVQSSLKKQEGDLRGYWYNSVGGDLNAPHYFVVTSYPNFAAMDKPMDGVWDVVEKADGKKKREQLQADYRDAVDQSWSYMYRRVGDLSHAGN